MFPLGPIEVKLTSLDACHNGCCTVLATPSLEWGPSRQHRVENNSEGPEIATRVITRLILTQSVSKDFGGSVVESKARGLHGLFLLGFQSCKAKVNNFDLRVVTRVHIEQVLKEVSIPVRLAGQ